MTITDTAAAPRTEARVAHHRTYLMCRPDHFTVSYRINPWMHPDTPTDTALALRQWDELYRVFVGLGHDVELIEQDAELPDMVYAANGGFTLDGIAYSARFAHAERAAEGPLYAAWFGAHGFSVADAAQINEGEGDFLLAGDVILAGSGFRSTVDSQDELAAVTGREVIGLTLVDPRFYHLDTALVVLDPLPEEGSAPTIAYLPAAFDEASRAVLEQRFPDAILVSDDDAVWLGLNAISDGLNVVIAARATGFEAQLRERGYNPIGVDLSELLRGGGGVKCCTLELRR
ncbi:dimethylargininase [Amnibacterium flavum]|uniref:N-dimethylarginine dimethylaminohydrolase n=1 Tax=Amnibacterium flavum TaxID=2173173 RepID=A0A2V1HT65_9MICO|nr:dimethylargininase [Amnibacterium flavum]PVZ95531.1 N-dimethylarginine dimethylaminohydrolase [Amnibacterium flavum]